MNTDHQHSQPPEDDALVEREDEAGALMQLLEELDSIDEHARDAVINKFSMDDNNGRRIEFITRRKQQLAAFIFLRRLLYIPRKTTNFEQADGA